MAFVSGSADNSVKIWTRSSETCPFELSHTLNGHTQSILVAYSFWNASKKEFISVTSGSDQKLCFWINSECIAVLTNKFYTFDAKIVLPSKVDSLEQLIFATAGSDSRIHLLKISASFVIVQICELAGHQEWIRSLDCVFNPDG